MNELIYESACCGARMDDDALEALKCPKCNKTCDVNFDMTWEGIVMEDDDDLFLDN